MRNDNSQDCFLFIEGNLNNGIAAEFQAFVLISNELNQKIKSIKSPHTQPIQHLNLTTVKSPITWTTAISKCIEICYALYLLNVINDGKATLKQITEAVGEAFNIDLSEYAQSMKFIKKRKRDGLFLTEMSNALFQFISNSNQ